MQDASKRQHLIALIERLRDHLERIGPSEGFERELAKAEAELQAIEGREQPPS